MKSQNILILLQIFFLIFGSLASAENKPYRRLEPKKVLVNPYGIDVLGLDDTFADPEPILPEPDPQCNESFVRQFEAQAECFGLNPSFCFQLGVMGLALAGGYGGNRLGEWIAKGLNQIHPDKAAFERYSQFSMDFRTNASALEWFRRELTDFQDRNSISASEPEKRESAEYKQRLREHLMNNLQRFSRFPALQEKLMIALSIIEKGKWTVENLPQQVTAAYHNANRQLLLQAFDAKFADEFDKHDRQIEEVRKKDKTLERDLAKLREDLKEAKKENNLGKILEVDEQIGKRFDLHAERVGKEIFALEQKWYLELEKRGPAASLYANLWNLPGRSGSYEDWLQKRSWKHEAWVDIEEHRVRWGRWKGKALGGVAGAVALPVLGILNDQKVKLCARNLHLSDDELAILVDSVGGKSLLGHCNEYGLENEYHVLDRAMKKFGFIPRGLCKLALNASTKYDWNIGKHNELKHLDCRTITTSQFAVKEDKDGKRQFSCTHDKMTYSAPWGEDNAPDFLNLTSFALGRERPADSNLKQELSSIYTEKNLARRKENIQYCDKNREPSARCTCEQGAKLAQIALMAASRSPKCLAEKTPALPSADKPGRPPGTP